MLNRILKFLYYSSTLQSLKLKNNSNIQIFYNLNSL
ncbi:hypothetical protein pb186bvf_012260 [Paramecium bursaria]